MRTPELVTALNAVEETTTSAAINIGDVKKATIEFTEGGTVLNRSGAMTVEVSLDGTTYTQYNMLVSNVANANTEQITRVASVTRAAEGTDLVVFEGKMPAKFMRVTVTVTDGETPTGNFSVKVLKQYR